MKKIIFFAYFIISPIYALEVLETSFIIIKETIAGWKNYINNQDYDNEILNSQKYHDFLSTYDDYINNYLEEIEKAKEKGELLKEKPRFFIAIEMRGTTYIVEGIMVIDYEPDPKHMAIFSLCSAPWNLFGPHQSIKGVGTSLINEAIKIARREREKTEKMETIELVSTESAVSFYEEMGFREDNRGAMVFNLTAPPFYNPKKSSLYEFLKNYRVNN